MRILEHFKTELAAAHPCPENFAFYPTLASVWRSEQTAEKGFADARTKNWHSSCERYGKAGPFPVERLKTDLPFVHVLCVHSEVRPSSSGSCVLHHVLQPFAIPPPHPPHHTTIHRTPRNSFTITGRLDEPP